MGKKSPPPKAPDLKPITDAQIRIASMMNDVAREQLGISREQFAWMKENSQQELELARTQADRLFELQTRAFESDEEAKAFARQVGQSQIDAMNLQMDYARRDRERWEQVFLPMQDRYIEEANNYDTAERRELEAGRATADMQRQADVARQNADARLRSMGIDPSQMRSASLLQTQDVALAGQQALAGNAARQSVQDRGRAMRADAMNVGAGLPAQALAGFAGAGGSGAGAIGAGMAGQQATLGALQGGAGLAGTALGFRSAALNNVAALTGSPMQWAGMAGNMMGGASSAYGNAANTMSQDFSNRMSSWKAGQEQAQQSFNNIMSVASLAGGMMMAEGGEVRMAEGGFLRGFGRGRGPSKAGGAAGKAATRGASASLAREFPLVSAAFGPGKKDAAAIGKAAEKSAGAMGQKSRSWAERARAMRAENDPYIRSGEGSGEGGALTLDDRITNGATAANRFSAAATNTWEGQTGSDPQVMVPQTQLMGDNMQYAAEGGRIQARGALPVKQVRDRIPAWLSEGEYVIPADVVRSVGIEKLDKLVAKYHREGA